VAVSGTGVVNETGFSVPALSRGVHSLKLRTFSGGTWSSPVSNFVRVGSALIDGAEVYFDTDPGEGNGSPVPVDVPGLDVAAYETALPVDAPGTGFHTAHMRFRGGGVWSFTKSSTMRINDAITGDVNEIVAGEFFVDADPGEGNGCPLFAADGDFDSPEELVQRYVPGESLGAGQHVVFVRVQDASGKWTGAQPDTVTISESFVTIIPEALVNDADVRVSWSKYPEAAEYRVHYDDSADGPFSNFVSVAPPDTSVVIETEEGVEFFKVVVVEPAAQPCPEEAPAALTKKSTEISYK
jgi:hypothetical protein